MQRQRGGKGEGLYCSLPVKSPVMKYKSVSTEILIGKGSRLSSVIVKSAVVNT